MNKNLLLLPGIFCLAATACKQTVETSGTIIPVKVVSVVFSEGIDAKSYVGTVEPAKEATIFTPWQGTLTEIKVGQGDKVRASQVIASIDAQSVKSALESAQAAQVQAQDAYDRMTKMHDEGVITDIQLVEIQTKLDQANASLKAAQKALEDCSVKAPFAGVIGDTYAEQGQDLSPSQAIAKIYDVSSLEIHISVPESEIGDIKLGEKVTFEVPALGAGTRFDGKVKTKGVVASAVSHCYDCTVVPMGDTSGLLAGMVCKAWLSGDTRGGVIIPASVVKTDQQGKYVWTIDSENVVHKTFVQTGGFAGKGVVVTAGLSEGDRVVTEGVQKISSGMKVRVTQ